MKLNNILKVKLILMVLTIMPCISIAKVPQIHIYRNDDKKFHKVEGNVTVQHHISDQDSVLILTTQDSTFSIPLTSVERITSGFNDIPTLKINTPAIPDLYQLVEKETYLDATVEIDGNGAIEDAEAAEVKIKGRGNSTWNMPKKPMRLKFSKKISFAGLKKAKNFVLLANYIDPTLMRNAIAMKMAQLLEIPYANHIVPCNVVFNGHDLGCFMLTEKIGINSGSVDIDETKGMLFELSDEFDEPYKFRSDIYNLPVMVKDPDLEEISSDNPELGSPSEILEKWKADFNRAEDLVSKKRGFEAFDINSCVDYFLLYNICGNNEIGFPKSFYIHKEAIGDKHLYKLGPAWDFDVAFNICNLNEDGELQQIFTEGDIWMNDLILKLYNTPGFKELYKKRLNYFYKNLYPKVLEYFDEYASSINTAAKVNGTIWPENYYNDWIYVNNTFDHESIAKDFRNWLQNRVEHLKKSVIGAD